VVEALLPSFSSVPADKKSISADRSHRPMGNRHHNKGLRTQVRARMARTGESYQKALARVLAERTSSAPGSVDLVPIEYFGVPAALATYDLLGRLACVVVSGRGRPMPFPRNPLVALATRGRLVVH
jgi:hypothetical protein